MSKQTEQKNSEDLENPIPESTKEDEKNLAKKISETINEDNNTDIVEPPKPTQAKELEIPELIEITDEYMYDFSVVKHGTIFSNIKTAITYLKNSPIMCFYGPYGLGKTYLMELIQAELKKDPNNIIYYWTKPNVETIRDALEVISADYISESDVYFFIEETDQMSVPAIDAIRSHTDGSKNNKQIHVLYVSNKFKVTIDSNPAIKSRTFPVEFNYPLYDNLIYIVSKSFINTKYSITQKSELSNIYKRIKSGLYSMNYRHLLNYKKLIESTGAADMLFTTFVDDALDFEDGKNLDSRFGKISQSLNNICIRGIDGNPNENKLLVDSMKAINEYVLIIKMKNYIEKSIIGNLKNADAFRHLAILGLAYIDFENGRKYLPNTISLGMLFMISLIKSKNNFK